MALKTLENSRKYIYEYPKNSGQNKIKWNKNKLQTTNIETPTNTTRTQQNHLKRLGRRTVMRPLLSTSNLLKAASVAWP